MRDWLLPPGSYRRAVVAYLSRRVAGRREQESGPRAHLDYARWICLSEPAEAELAQQRRQSFANGPRISILVPVHETPASFLEGMLDSVLSQTYGNWELCLADGGSQSKDVRRLLEEYARRDPRIRVAFLAENRGVAGNSAAGAWGWLPARTWCCWITTTCWHRLLFTRWLGRWSGIPRWTSSTRTRTISTRRDVTGLTSSPTGRRTCCGASTTSATWSCCAASCWSASAASASGFDGAQDYDLVLRATEQARRIHHIPRVLYHWRMHAGSLSHGVRKLESWEAGQRACRSTWHERASPAAWLPA